MRYGATASGPDGWWLRTLSGSSSGQQLDNISDAKELHSLEYPQIPGHKQLVKLCTPRQRR